MDLFQPAPTLEQPTVPGDVPQNSRKPLKTLTIAVSILAGVTAYLFLSILNNASDISGSWSGLINILVEPYLVGIGLIGIIVSLAAFIKTKNKRFIVFIVFFALSIYSVKFTYSDSPLVGWAKDFKIYLYDQDIKSTNAQLDVKYKTLYDKISAYLAAPRSIKETASGRYLILEDNTVIGVINSTNQGVPGCSITQICQALISKTPIKIEPMSFEDFKAALWHESAYGDYSSHTPDFIYNDKTGTIKMNSDIYGDSTGHIYTDNNINQAYGMIPALVYIDGKPLNPVN